MKTEPKRYTAIGLTKYTISNRNIKNNVNKHWQSIYKLRTSKLSLFCSNRSNKSIGRRIRKKQNGLSILILYNPITLSMKITTHKKILLALDEESRILLFILQSMQNQRETKSLWLGISESLWARPWYNILVSQYTWIREGLASP